MARRTKRTATKRKGARKEPSAPEAKATTTGEGPEDALGDSEGLGSEAKAPTAGEGPEDALGDSEGLGSEAKAQSASDDGGAEPEGEASEAPVQQGTQGVAAASEASDGSPAGDDGGATDGAGAGEASEASDGSPAGEAGGAAAGEGVQTELSVEEPGPSPRLLSILESLLFASDKPLKVPTLRKLLGERSPAKVKRALRALQAAHADSGILVVEVDGGFQLRTNPDNAQWVRRLEEVKPVRMSRAGLEVLSVVAYRQPVTRVEIDQIRGVDSGAVLRQLLQRDLLRIVGRKDEPGRPFLYSTTHEFLSFFGLASLADLPSLRDVNELAREQVEASKVPAEAPDTTEGDAEDPAAQPDAPTPDAEGARQQEAGEQLDDAEAEDLLPDAEEIDEGDDELLEALTEASEAARGAERIKRSLRKMAAEQAEAVEPESEAGKMLSSLADVVAARRKRKKTPPSPGEDGVQPDGEDGVQPEGEDGVQPDGEDGVQPEGAPAPGSEPASKPVASAGRGDEGAADAAVSVDAPEGDPR